MPPQDNPILGEQFVNREKQSLQTEERYETARTFDRESDGAIYYEDQK